MNQPIMHFDSHIAGKNAMVTLWPDRIEWTRAGMSTGAKAALGAMTFGASLVATGVRGRKDDEIILIRSITSVNNKKSGLTKTEVNVHTPAGVVSFRCSGREAEEFKRHLLALMANPQQQVVIQHQAAPPPPQRPPMPPQQQRPPQPDPMQQLQQLAQMRDAGILTVEEFEGKKAEILRRM